MWIAVALLGLVSIALGILFSKSPQVQAESFNPQQDKDNARANEPILKQSLIWLTLGFVTYVAIVTLNMTAGFYIQDKFYLSSQQSAVYFSQCMLVVGVCLVLTQLLIVKVFKLKLNSLVIIGLVTMCFGLLLSLTHLQFLYFRPVIFFMVFLWRAYYLHLPQALLKRYLSNHRLKWQVFVRRHRH
jgi:predicted MFS family arabinose efflux permease